MSRDPSTKRVWQNAGAPSSGGSGTLAGNPWLEKGDLLIDTTNGALYQNTNTQASPTWAQISSGGGVSLDTEVGNMAASGTSTANALGSGSTAAPIDHVHKLGTHDHSDDTKGGSLGVITIDTATITNDASVGGDLTVTGDVDITGNLTVTGTFGITGDWDIGGTLTADEIILDTDGAAPAATNAYIVSDNTGDLTANALSGKEFHIAIAGADEYDFSATILDMNGNALDNTGYIILNAATAPGATEVYLVNDNSGDLTLNAKSTKSIHLAIAGADEYDFSATVAAFGANNLTFSTGYIQFSGAGYIDLGASGYIIGTGTVASAGIIRLANDIYALSARNAGDSADVDMIKVDSSDHIAFGASLAATTFAGTLSMADQKLDFTTGYIEFGTTPAGAGDIRQENNVVIWAARNAGDDGDISGWKVNASDDYEAAADVNLAGNTIYGATAADGNLVLSSTINATKGYVGIPAGEEGLKIGGTADRATTVGDNVLHIFDGAAAPAGTLANGISLYSEGGECKVLDAAGNSTTLSPHTDDGDYVIHSFANNKGQTITIHLEKLLKALVAKDKTLEKYVEVVDGISKRPVWAS